MGALIIGFLNSVWVPIIVACLCLAAVGGLFVREGTLTRTEAAKSVLAIIGWFGSRIAFDSRHGWALTPEIVCAFYFVTIFGRGISRRVKARALLDRDRLP